MTDSQLTSIYQAMNNSSVDLQDKLVYTDTSFVLQLIGNNNRDKVRQEECRNFSTYLSNQGSIMVTGPKVHEELRIAIPKGYILGKQQYNSQPIKEIIENTPGVIAQAKVELKKATAALKADPNFIHMEIEKFGLDYIENNIDPVFYGNDLLFPDASHYGFAKDQGIHNLVTTDKDYTCINDPDLLVIVDTGLYLKLLISKGPPIPSDILKYYIDECNRVGTQPSWEIQQYYNNLQKLKAKWTKTK